ncbi:hypothetical protein O9993_16570 [Vibrio lentus]|nr:hypothetical protein [Vibrio lentus]
MQTLPAVSIYQENQSQVDETMVTVVSIRMALLYDVTEDVEMGIKTAVMQIEDDENITSDASPSASMHRLIWTTSP